MPKGKKNKNSGSQFAREQSVLPTVPKVSGGVGQFLELSAVALIKTGFYQLIKLIGSLWPIVNRIAVALCPHIVLKWVASQSETRLSGS